MSPNLQSVLLTIFIVTMGTASGGPHHPPSDDYEAPSLLQEKQCEVNHECSPGFFCYLETNKCAPCISCASRFRLNSTWGCPQRASDCGECLPGYQEPSLERDVEKESCMPVPDGVITTNKNSAPSPAVAEEMVNLLWFFGGLGGLSLFVIASFLLTQWHRGRRNPQPQQAPTELQELVCHSNQPPPPYSPFGDKLPTAVNAAPSAPVMDSTLQVESPRDCDARIYVETNAQPQPPVPSVDHNHLVQAVPFRPPEWINTSKCTGLCQAASPLSDVSSDGPDLHDDNTQPSDWTPNTSQENAEEAGTQLMSFHTPQLVGSTAVGTVSPPVHRATNDLTRIRRRENEEDDPELASSQESCEEGAPQEKRMRSGSPPLQQTRNFHPEVFLSQNNSNVNNSSLQSFQTSMIQINLNLNCSDDNRTESEPSSNSLLDSEDFLT